MQHPQQLRFVSHGKPYQLDPECLDIENNKEQQNLLFDNLPELLLKGSDKFKTDEERLMFLYLTIAAFSGLLNNVTGQYRQRTERPNLYSVGTGRAGSGKGLIVFVQMLLMKVQQYYLLKSERDLKTYKAELAAFKIDKKQNPELKPPARPLFQVPLIPANSTSAALIKAIESNQPDVPQIMLESEIDSLVGAMEGDLVNISTILRKAFTGEPISIARKTDAEYVSIMNCQLAIGMVGTSNQFLKLVNNRSDGFLSRFLVYNVDTPPVASGIKPCPTCPNLTESFTKMADEVFDFWSFSKRSPLHVELQTHHWDILETYIKDRLQPIVSKYGDDGSQVLFRGGLQCFKICMVLSALRRYENAEATTEIICTDDDFATALQLVDTSIQHSFIFFESLPQVGLKIKSLQQEEFLEGVKESFTRSEALTLGKKMGVSETSVDRYLKKLTGAGKLRPVGKGTYQKV